MPDKMDRFTQRARRVLSLAQEEAETFQHNIIGTEHLLLGLMREEGGVSKRVLSDLGLDLNRVRELVKRMTNAKSGPTARLDLANDTKEVLELAVDEARRMGHHFIGTEHLLLGLMRRSEGTAMQIMKRLNVSPEEVRRQTRRVLQESSPKEGKPELVPPPPATPERIPNLAIDALGVALTTARSFGHGYVGVWHLLNGLTAAGVSGRVLHELRISVAQVAEILGNEPVLVELVPEGRILPRVQNALEAAIDEARARKHKYVQSEDLLLALVRQNPAIFEQLGLKPDDIRAKVEEVLKSQPPPNAEQKDDPQQPAQ
jgi:ATP-dependent Clp protease ATP-binding subunit ClpA